MSPVTIDTGDEVGHPFIVIDPKGSSKVTDTITPGAAPVVTPTAFLRYMDQRRKAINEYLAQNPNES